ncbi:hypothetical protein ACTL6U_06770 [Rhodovibrionaceae bacterium A322]
MSQLLQDALSSSQGGEIIPGQGDFVAVGNHHTVDSSQPLPGLDQPRAQAFHAVHNGADDNSCFALVCDPDYAPRLGLLTTMSRMDRLPLMVPKAWGSVFWPPANAVRVVIIFNRPLGGRVQQNYDSEFPIFKEDDLMEKVVEPLIGLMQDLLGRGFQHRNIRATNLYWADENQQQIMLGECITSPSGVDQPLLYETINSGLAMPEGRGRGTPADELYAIGALVATLITGHSPGRDIDDETLLQRKIEKGSYAALVGNSRVTLKIMELLRGVLCDELMERWNITELVSWMEGRQLSPKQPFLPTKGARPFHFDGKDYSNCKSLAAAFSKNFIAAREVLGSESLPHWIERSIGDEALATAVTTTIKASGAGGEQSVSDSRLDRMVTRLISTLDPPGPLRFKEVAVDVESLPQALALRFQDKEFVALFANMANYRLPQTYVESLSQTRVDLASLRPMYDNITFNLTRRRPGYGIERCLYQYNDHFPCLSPLVQNQQIRTAAEILPALELYAAKAGPDEEPIDTHLVAFAAAHTKSMSERVLQALGNKDQEVMHNLGIIAFLATLQDSYGPAQLPNLTQWAGRFTGPIVESLHSQKLRKTLTKNIDKALAAGNLVGLLQVVDDGNLRARDEKGYALARQEYATAVQEIAWLQQGGLTHPDNVNEKSRGAAAVVSGVLSGIGFLLMTLVFLF